MARKQDLRDRLFACVNSSSKSGTDFNNFVR